MPNPFCEHDLLAEFDRRHGSGKIFYDDQPQIQRMTINGFEFEFAITGAIGKKPYIKNDHDEPPAPDPLVRRPTGYAPGSDIDVSGYEITDINDTHLLAFNKFCMYRPHLLLLTKDGYRRQYDHLDVEDFRAGLNALEILQWNYFMFFNCGKDGGCSRLHKHIQLAPYQRGRLAPWPDSADTNPDSVPYEFILRRFEKELGPEEIVNVYDQMMDEARACLGQEAGYVPHNLVLGRNWILVIPRRNAGSKEAYANSLGMMGMVSVASKEESKCWLDQGPLEVIKHLGVPRNRK